jgi:hypothetical protein
MMKDWMEGGHGYIPTVKPDGTIRILMENWNSLKYFTEKNHDRIHRIDALRRKYSADILAGCEVQTDWSMAERDKQFDDLFGLGIPRQGGAAHNTEDEGITNRCQPGGVAAIAFGKLSEYVKVEPDPTGLARWITLTLTNEERVSRVVMAYKPCYPSAIRRRGKDRLGSTVWEQQDRYWRKRDNFDDPRDIFNEDLLALLRKWRAAKEEVILMGDFNEDIYKDKLGRALLGDDIQMCEQYHRLCGEKAPFSHISGKRPIMGVFSSPGIDCTAALVCAHKIGVGDHRMHVFDFSSKSLLGIESPVAKRPSGRNLHCSIERQRVNYNRVLIQLTKRHRMFKKANILHDAAQNILPFSPAEFQLMYNNWDKEMIELMLAAEKRCRKIKTDTIAWSPVIGEWTRRLNLYRWLIRYRKGLKVNLSNLERSCQRAGFPHPSRITLEAAQVNERACILKLDSYRRNAPEMRKRHLQERLNAAHLRRDEKAAAAIIKILRREYNAKKFSRLRAAFGKKRGYTVSRVAERAEEGPDTVYSSRHEVETAGAAHLTGRYREANHAPANSGALLDDIGQLGAGQAVQDILRGTYEYPPEMDHHTRLLLQEAAFLFAQTAEDVVSTFVTTKDFQEWWLTANEDIQSSRSLAHFGHYKAAAYNDYLSALHAAKLNLALQTGIPLERWGHGLTVLLEKEFGSIYLDKLRAICLFEADFNWLQKLIFSKRMMTQCLERGQIPDEQFAKSATTATEGTMMKILHNDIHRTMHIPSAVVSADLRNCYDSVLHSILSIGLQSVGVPLLAIKLVMLTLQTMSFWLLTAFGESKQAFGGTTDNPFFGISQGGGWSPSAFAIDSTLMINAYKRLGHGCNYISAITGTIFFFAAILYVDDTDLLVIARSPTEPLEEFYSRIQSFLWDWAKLVQASGGSLKPPKCYVSINTYKFVGGKARVQKLREAAAPTFTVPQPDGSTAEIITIEPTTAKKTLGVWTNTAGAIIKPNRDKTLQDGPIKDIQQKGNEWVNDLSSNRFIQPRDGWLSTQIHLKPKLEWGLVCFCDDFKKLDEAIHSIYYRSLSKLQVNRHTKREWRMLSEQFQGHGLFDITLDCLGARLYFHRRFWKTSTPVGKMLHQAYETFQMDVGLQGNLFTRNFDHLGHLASDCWFKKLWELCHRFNVDLSLHPSNDVPLTRTGDRALMELFYNAGCYNKVQLDILNRVRKYKCSHSVSDIVDCDGFKVKPSILTTEIGISSRRFSYEQPTGSDFTLWRAAVAQITSPSFTLTTRLGQYIAFPHHESDWYASNDKSTLFRLHSDDTCDVYCTNFDGRTPRSQVYERQKSIPSLPKSVQFASVDTFDPNFVQLRSTATIPPPLNPPTELFDVLRSYGNDSLWRHLEIDGDGKWLRRGLLLGTLIMVHDGSYMRDVAPDVSSAAVIIKCTRTDFKLRAPLRSDLLRQATIEPKY